MKSTLSVRPKLALYWGASCGGCEVAVLNLHERFLEMAEQFDFFFCPCLLDTKKETIEALPDTAIALSLFNGAVRTDENLAMARLLRQKSALLIAFGSCAAEGCIPGLSNFYSRAEHFRAIYLDSPSLDNPSEVLPAVNSSLTGNELSLPPFHERVTTLSQSVPVDYTIPGCPPEPEQVWALLQSYLEGKLPAPGSLVGCGSQTVCEECDRVKSDKRLHALYRNHEIIPDRQACLLEQGLLCMGIVTRNGCGAPCTEANMPCTGCYGPPEGVFDQGGKMVAALGSILCPDGFDGNSADNRQALIDALLERIPDYAGLFYKYGLAASLLGGTRKEKQ